MLDEGDYRQRCSGRVHLRAVERHLFSGISGSTGQGMRTGPQYLFASKESERSVVTGKQQLFKSEVPLI